MPTSESELLQVYQLLGALIKERYGADPARCVPAQIFRSSLSPFSSLVSYLSQQGRNEKEIAKLLSRNKTFVRHSLSRQEVKGTGVLLPLDIFVGELSVLEAAAFYLHGKGMSNKEIGFELGKSASVVWTLLKRAEKKGGLQ